MTPEQWRRVEEIYNASLEQEPLRRGAFLLEVCPEDEEVRREVESLLRRRDTPDLVLPAIPFADSPAPGTSLGPYQLLNVLGAGGMGLVYRARDTRLDRLVALKVLRPGLAGSPGHADRFAREARVISNLNHPRICTLHDVGEQDGVEYLVMEYLEGKILAARLAEGPLPVAQVLQYGIDIADALAAAHAHRIIHRDLKPGNIMILKSGIKVLDFGLAKFTCAAEEDPTLEMITGSQTIVGTPAYMAPEQLAGSECDHRTDVFALGLLLYEMVAGRRPFRGDSRAELLADIMRAEPPALEEAHPHLAHLIERCLANNPADRWQSAHDLALELRWIQRAKPEPHPRSQPRLWMTRERLVWLMAVILAVSIVPVSRFYSSRSHPPVARVEFDLPPPTAGALLGIGFPLRISPDGTYLALRATGPDGRYHLWVRPVGSSAARLLSGTAGAMEFFWSPDNKQLAFFSSGTLRKIDIHGGPVLDLCEFLGTGNGTWGRQGDILFETLAGELYRTSDKGKEVERIFSSGEGEPRRWPQFLPDGRRYLFHTRADAGGGVQLGSLGVPEAKMLIPGASHGMYTRPPGSSQAYILFKRKRLLMAQLYDEERQQVTGEAFVVTTRPLIYARGFWASENGVLVYRSGNSDNSLVWMNRRGQPIETLPERGDYRQMSLSPDGTVLALTRVDDDDISNIWLIELARGGISTRLTQGKANHWFPLWSPDGRIAYSLWETAKPNLYVRAAAGGDAAEPLLRSSTITNASSWSRDGQFLAYWATDAKTRHDIWILPMGKGGTPFRLFESTNNELHAEFSADGNWIAYTSDESGRQEIYVRKFDGGPVAGGARRISFDGGSLPKWRQDGKELFYVAPDQKLMSVAIGYSRGLTSALPRPLFQTRLRLNDVFVGYAVAANGQRFLINTPVEDANSAPMTVVVNWSPGAKP